VGISSNGEQQQKQQQRHAEMVPQMPFAADMNGEWAAAWQQ
jgi:hypothetical protein